MECRASSGPTEPCFNGRLMKTFTWTAVFTSVITVLLPCIFFLLTKQNLRIKICLYRQKKLIYSYQVYNEEEATGTESLLLQIVH